MSAIITFIPSLVLPSLFQIVLSGSQVVILPTIEVITSVIYMVLTAMGCGGCGLGGGTVGAIGAGGLVGTIMGWVAMLVGALGLGGGVIGGGTIVGGIVFIIEEAIGALASAYNTVLQLIA